MKIEYSPLIKNSYHASGIQNKQKKKTSPLLTTFVCGSTYYVTWNMSNINKYNIKNILVSKLIGSLKPERDFVVANRKSKIDTQCRRINTVLMEMRFLNPVL